MKPWGTPRLSTVSSTSHIHISLFAVVKQVEVTSRTNHLDNKILYALSPLSAFVYHTQKVAIVLA